MADNQKKEVLEDLKGMHITVSDLINKLGGEPEGRLKFSLDDMNDHFKSYLGDIAMLIENRFFDAALEMARAGGKIDWRTDHNEGSSNK